MHTIWVRLNAVVFFGLTVLLGLSVLTALSTFFHQGKKFGRGMTREQLSCYNRNLPLLHDTTNELANTALFVHVCRVPGCQKAFSKQISDFPKV